MVNQYNQYNFEVDFKKYLLAGNVKAATLKNYLSDLRHFLGWLTISNNVGTEHCSVPTDSNNLNQFTAQNLTVETLENYKQYLTSNNIPSKTINRRLSTLRKFFSFCISQGWMNENPAKKVRNIVHSRKESFSTSPASGASSNNNPVVSEAEPYSSSESDVTSDESRSINEKSTLSYVLKNYKKSLVKKGCSNSEIETNIIDVKDFLQTINIPSS